MNDFGTFTSLWLQSSAYYAALIWLCWIHWRVNGADYLLFPAFWLGGLYLIAKVGGDDAFVPALGIVAAALAGIAYRSTRREAKPADETSLVPGLVVALLLLAVFDLLTGHAPQYVASQAVGRQAALAAIFAAMVVTILCLVWSGGATRLRIGYDARWTEVFWDLRRRRDFLLLPASCFAAWLIALAAPLTSTGALSGPIFRDSLMAILAARIISARPPYVILVLGLAVGLFRSVAGIAFDAASSLALMDVALLVALFLFAGAGTHRSVWEPAGRG